MTRYWFTEYAGLNWDPRIHQYNGHFAEVVRTIRAWFYLKRAQPGIDVTTGHKVEYTLQRNIYYVEVRQFQWNLYRDTDKYTTPQFRLDVTVYNSNGRRFFSGPLIVEFYPDFPQRPPMFRIDTKDYRFEDTTRAHQISHHVHADGWFCIMGGGYTGYSREEWDPGRDTVLVGINRAFDFIIYHVNKHGW